MGQPGPGFYQQQPPPERPNRASLWIALAAIGVLVVGGGVTAFMVTLPGSSPPSGQTTGSSTPTTTAPSEPNTTCQSVKPDWNCLPVPTLSYSYDVPKGWSPTQGTAPVEGMENVQLTGLTISSAYDCGGSGFTRGGAGGVVVPQTDLTAVAKDFAQKLATQYYRSAPTSQVKLGEPKPVKVPSPLGDIEGVQVDATATTSGNECLATKGMVKVLVLKGDKSLHVFMANGDLEGGPAEPKPPTEADLQGIVDSVKPLSAG